MPALARLVTITSSRPAPTVAVAPSVSNFTFTWLALYEPRSKGDMAVKVVLAGTRVPRLVHVAPLSVDTETVIVLLAATVPP